MNPSALVKQIKQKALEAGYVDCGIASTEPFTRFAEIIERRKEDYLEAASLYDQLLQRAFPNEQKFPAKSLVVCVHWYGKYKIPPSISGGIGRHYLFDRRYPGCPDNKIPKRMKSSLKELGFRVKQGGVPERWAAARAGVARFGYNNFMYTEKYGSWITIETFRVDHELPVDEPAYDSICPKNCRICIDACPSGALGKPFNMRYDHCVAYLTHSAPEPVEERLWNCMGKWIYGCDDCQLGCPLNKDKWQEKENADWLE
ncbi:MAG: epoxyqueuosine reductase, partial [Lentisphaeria bacterium]